MSNERSVETSVRKAQERLHIDNTTKSGFNALDSLGKVDSAEARYFTYQAADVQKRSI